jgi:hypothetical protein
MSVARSSFGAMLGAGLLAIAACDSGSDAAADGGAGAGGSIAPAGGASAASGSGSADKAGSSAGSSAVAGSNSAGASSADRLAPDALYGSFTLRLVPPVEATSSSPAAAAQTSFIGFATEGETPVANAWVQDQTANGCTLYTPKAPFCDPACGTSAVCVSDDKCVKNATSKPVGTIVLKGLKDGDVSMSPLGTNNNYQPKAGTTLPFPPCVEGAAVSLAVDGGAYKGFELSARCISPLEFNGSLKLVKGSAAKLEWKTPGDSKLARIKVRLDISHHGGSRGKIECDVEDTGSLELSAAMVTKLLDLGVAGYPTIILTRIVSGGVASGEPQHVTFLVQESVERAVEIDGLLSCTENSQCTAPKTCQSDLTCK